MARTKSDDGSNSAGAFPEKPFFHRLVELERQKEAIVEDVREVCREAKGAGIPVKGLRLAVKRYLEDSDTRTARELTEHEAERILRALGEFAETPLGESAIRSTYAVLDVAEAQAKKWREQQQLRSVPPSA